MFDIHSWWCGSIKRGIRKDEKKDTVTTHTHSSHFLALGGELLRLESLHTPLHQHIAYAHSRARPFLLVLVSKLFVGSWFVCLSGEIDARASAPCQLHKCYLWN